MIVLKNFSSLIKLRNTPQNVLHTNLFFCRLKAELENLTLEHKETLAQLQLSQSEKINCLREQLQEAECFKSKAEKEVTF